MNPLLAGSIVGAIGNIIDDLHTSTEEKRAADLEERKIALEEFRAEGDLVSQQIRVNEAEAQHSSLFVAGWRPGAGWVGVFGLGYQFVLYPLLTWAWAIAQSRGVLPADISPPPLLDSESLMILLTGMLGLAGLRTFERAKGKIK